eukprot:364637_1
MNECHELVIEFDKYIDIITDIPKEYSLLLQYVGIERWINSVHGMMDNYNVKELGLFIDKGKSFKIRKTNESILLLEKRLNKLESCYKQFDEMYLCVENKDKNIELGEYKKVIRLAKSLKIDINSNEKLVGIQENIKKIEEWEKYLKGKMKELWGKNKNNNSDARKGKRNKNNNSDARKGKRIKNKKKRKYSDLDENYCMDEEHKYKNGSFKKRKKVNKNVNVKGKLNEKVVEVFWWKRAMDKEKNEYILDRLVDYGGQRRERKNEKDILDSLQDVAEKSLVIAVKSELENKMKLMLDNIKTAMNEGNELIGRVNDNNVLIGIDESEIMKIKNNVENILKDTMIEFKIKMLLWKWHAIYYLNDINGINDKDKDNKMEMDNDNGNVDVDIKYWGLYKLFYEGSVLGLTDDDCKEWKEINNVYNDVLFFENICIGLLCKGNVDCKRLLDCNKKLKNTNLIGIIKHCIGEKDEMYMECLNKNVIQINKISDRMELFLDFYDKNFVNDILTYDNLELLYSEMKILSKCINKNTIGNGIANGIESTLEYMNNIFNKLDELYFYRPHKDKCSLIKWINFQFLQFNIMYKNNGIIQMDKYRLNTVDHCYCICRFTYTQNMKENNEKIPEMIGCEDCAEWYHAECIMLDDKDMRKFFNSKRTKFICPRCCYYEYNNFYKHFPSLQWNQIDLVKLNELENIININNENNNNNNIILCHSDLIDGVNRLVSWIKIW